MTTTKWLAIRYQFTNSPLGRASSDIYGDSTIYLTKDSWSAHRADARRFQNVKDLLNSVLRMGPTAGFFCGEGTYTIVEIIETTVPTYTEKVLVGGPNA